MSSLNRDEWQEMWDSIKQIERYASYMENHSNSSQTKERAKLINLEVRNIKRQIQEVIGQME